MTYTTQGDLRNDLRRRSLGAKTFHSVYANPKFVADLELVKELRGHSGCVNALCWSHDGRLLASGSDDHLVNIYSAYSDDFKLSLRVNTDHTANIFGVKFLPHTGERTLVSCAGDGEIRVFDLERKSTPSSVNHANHVFRCHNDRVKRLVTEDSPHTFISCSEDGEVRDFDLRQPNQYLRHSTSPPPLVSYYKYGIDINTISVSRSNPNYLAVGGSHVHLFLHDRRMIGRELSEESGRPVGAESEPDRCVKKFAPHAQKHVGKRQSHITACKFSDARPNQLIGSWSAENVYLFDINASEMPTTPTECGEGFARKRKRHRREQDTGQTEKLVLEYPDGEREEMDVEDLGNEGDEEPRGPTSVRSGLWQASLFTKIAIAIFNESSYSSAFSMAGEFIQHYHRLRYCYDAFSKRRRIYRWVVAAGQLSRVLSSQPDSQPSTARIGDRWSFRYEFLKNVLSWLEGRGYEPVRGGSEEALNECGPVKEGPSTRVLFRTEYEMSSAFERASRSVPSDPHARSFWGEQVGRALLQKLKEGMDFSFVDDAWLKPTEDIYGSGDHVPSEGSNEEDDEEDDEDGLNYEDEDEEDEDENMPFERRASTVAKTVPVAGHMRMYKGHCNVQTVKDVNFYGADDEYVVSGSDDGNLFIWDCETTAIRQILRGDKSVVNVIQGHPVYPTLAVSGIDNTVKIFSPDANRDGSHYPLSRKRLHDEYQITSVNEVTRRQGLRDTYMTRHMLAHLATRIRERRAQNESELVLDECSVQ